ncbi:MAG: hypothetical protein LBK72_05480 [Bifidobacteriaceae bacterium]|nr:hypothetical protein [Bifidobacteriaceae bacterium]
MVFSTRQSHPRRIWREVAAVVGVGLVASALVTGCVNGERGGDVDRAAAPSGMTADGSSPGGSAVDGRGVEGFAPDGPGVDGPAREGSARESSAADGPAKKVRSTEASSANSPATFGPSPLPSVFESLSPEGLVAEGFRACMVEAGVPISAVALPDGALYVGFRWQDVESALGRDPAGQVSWAILSENRDPRQVLAKTVAERGGGYVLVVNGADMSGPFETCHGQYPYAQPDYEYDWNPIEEYAQEAEAGAAASTWATCARANGFPDVEDPADLVIDGDGVVEMVIPLSTEPEVFAALLDACPPSISVGDYAVQVHVRPEGPIEARQPGGSFAGAPSSDGDTLTAMYTELMDLFWKAEREAAFQGS